MKTKLLFLGIFNTLFCNAQTFVYSANADGTKDMTNYYYFISDQFFKCVNCKEALKDSRSFEKTLKLSSLIMK